MDPLDGGARRRAAGRRLPGAKKANLPRALAAFNKLAITILRMLGKTNIAAAMEKLSYSPRASLAIAVP